MKPPRPATPPNDRFKGWPWLATTINRPAAQVALARGDLATARRYADADVDAALGWFTVQALTTRARVALAQKEFGQAERDAHEALVRAVGDAGFPFRPRPAGDSSALWPAAAGRPPGRAPGSSARRMLFGSASASYASGSTTPGTRKRFRRRRKALGEKGFDDSLGSGRWRCPPRRRSPTRSAAAASGSDRPAVGTR